MVIPRYYLPVIGGGVAECARIVGGSCEVTDEFWWWSSGTKLDLIRDGVAWIRIAPRPTEISINIY